MLILKIKGEKIPKRKNLSSKNLSFVKKKAKKMNSFGYKNSL